MRGLGAQRDGRLRRPLSVAIDEPDVPACPCLGNRQIQRDRGFPDAALVYCQL